MIKARTLSIFVLFILGLIFITSFNSVVFLHPLTVESPNTINQLTEISEISSNETGKKGSVTDFYDYETIITEEFNYSGVSIRWFISEAVKLTYNGTVVYIDPNYVPSDSETANYIIITHDHRPHYSTSDIWQLSDENTTVISSPQISGYEYTVNPGKI